MAQQSYKKFVASAATATLVASALIPVASANVTTSAFTDVPASYKDAVDFVVTNNIASGKTETQFGISQQILRGDAAIMIAAAAGLNDKDAPSTKFTDVPTRGALAVNSLKAAGVISGKSDTKFGFNDNITRGEAALMLQKAFDLKAGETKNSFTDVKDSYDAAVDALVANGVTKGISATQFGTGNPIKRGDFAKFLFALKDQIVATGVAVETVKVTNETTTTVKLKEANKELVAKDFKVLVNGTPVTPTKVESDEKGEIYTITHPSLKGTQGIISVNGVQADFNFGPAVAPQVVDVSAINATTARVNFKGALPADVDFTNFEINGGLTVSNVQVSSDRKSAVITVSSEFIRNQEYTVSVFGIKDAEGKEYPETTGKFSWEVAEGVTVALESTTLDQGQTVGLTVKDQAGKDVKDAKVKVTSYNENLVTVSVDNERTPSSVKIIANDAKLAGTTDVVVETALPDGSVLTNTFKVTVKEAVTTVSNAGYTLVTSVANLNEDAANTAAFKKFATATTSLVEDTDAQELAAFGETNGNPDVAPINFTGATRVVSSNPIVATAVLNDDGTNGVITVDPLSAGTTTVTVTMKDGSRKSFPVTVTAAPVQKSISVNATNVKLSDENRNEAADAVVSSFQPGVDGQTINIKSLDQFNEATPFAAGKVTVSSSTEGIALYQDSAVLEPGNNVVAFAGSTNANVDIVAKKDTPVSNAKVTVSYFAKTTDTKPTVTKTITVNVADIDREALTSSIDVIAGSEIDANYEVSEAESAIAFTSAYALDSKGNRVEKVSAQASIAEANSADKFVTVDENTETLKFKSISNALTYLRASNTVNVVVEADGVTKVLPVTYKNTAVVPNKATVATSAVSVKLASGVPSITVEDILFGTSDNAQLILDDANLDGNANEIIGVLATAKNGGYTYNKPLVSVLGTDGKALATGVNVYGTDKDASANTWNNEILEALKGYTDATGFAADDFTVEYEIANSNNSGSTAGGIIQPASGKATTFTLVVRGIYTNGSVQAIENVGGNGPTAAQKAAHNLLAAPVQLNVSVSGQ